MLTLVGTKEENNTKTSTEYYYTQPHHHYYCPVSFNNDSNNFHHPSIYETNQYYTFSQGYTNHHHPNEENSNNMVSTSVYIPTYHHQQHYSSGEHTNEMFYSQQPSDQPITPTYNYNVSPIPALSSNYIPPSVEQAHCSTSNSTGYLTSYVSLKHILCKINIFYSDFILILVTFGWCLSIRFNYCRISQSTIMA